QGGHEGPEPVGEQCSGTFDEGKKSGLVKYRLVARVDLSTSGEGLQDGQKRVLSNHWDCIDRFNRQRGVFLERWQTKCSRDAPAERAFIISRNNQSAYARIPFTAWCSSTPVRRMSSPCDLKVKRRWSMPRQCRMVAFISWMCTG